MRLRKAWGEQVERGDDEPRQVKATLVRLFSSLALIHYLLYPFTEPVPVAKDTMIFFLRNEREEMLQRHEAHGFI